MSRFQSLVAWSLLLLAPSLLAATPQCADAQAVEPTREPVCIEVPAATPGEAPIRVRVYLPPGYRTNAQPGYPVLYIAVGAREEASDRDGDGVIDVVDDARDLLEGWTDTRGLAHKGIRQIGYSTNREFARAPDRAQAVLVLDPEGHHEQATWKRMLPGFLRWVAGSRRAAS